MPKTRDEIKYVLQSYKTVFGSEMGQVVLADLEKHCFASRPTIGPDPHLTYFNEGKRSVLLHIKRLLELDPEEYLKRFAQPETNEEGERE